MQLKTRFTPFTLALLSLLASHAHAETQLPAIDVKGQTAADGYEATESNTATKVAVPLRDVPQTVNVVTRAVMRDQNALSIQDALQNVPGLSFSVGDGQRDQVTIRGFTGITDQFVDGVRDDALYFRDLSNVERIEVLKGPASVLYGRGSAGGLVNRVTKKPQDSAVNEVGVTIGSEGQKRGEFDASGANSNKSVLFRVTGALEDSTGFREQYFLERKAIAPSVLFRLAPRTSVLLQADYLKDKRLADQGVPSYRGRPVDVPIETYFGAANGRQAAFVESEVASGTITLDHAFSDDLKLHSVLRSYDYSLDRNYTTIGKITDGVRPTVSIAQTHRTRDERGTYLQNELSQKLMLGNIKHQLLYGAEFGAQDKKEVLVSRPNAATYSLFNPVLATLGPLPASLVPSADNQNEFHTAALYVQDLMTLTPNLKMLAGLRYDRLTQKRDDRTIRNLDLERTDNTVSPRIGAVYQPRQDISLYASHSTSFQPIADAFVFYANSDQLKPTKTVSNELGAKFDLAAKASATIALFNMTQTNIQNADPANPSFAIPVGKQRTRGLEISISGEIAPRWEATAGYALMKGEIVSSPTLTSAGTPFEGNEAALTPRHTFNVWLKRKFDGGFYAAGGARAESARFASSDNLTTLPGYAAINLGAGYQSAKWDVTLLLKNLFNRKYYVAGHSGANDYNLPGEPRTLIVATRYRF